MCFLAFRSLSESPKCLFNVQMLQLPPKAFISERIIFFCCTVCWFSNEWWGTKIILTPLFSLVVFRVNLLGWAALKTISFPKKKLCVIDCCRFKRLSCFCFLFRSRSRITGLLAKNQVTSWLFPLIKMSQGVAINSWRGKEEYGLVPNSTGHLRHSLGGSCQTAF